MRAFAFAAALLAFAASAQTTETSRVSKGDLLKQRQYRTTGTATGALTFFVDPTGNDANQCTSAGVNACQTIQGSLSKPPKQLRDLVTINLAAGSYAGFIAPVFMMDPSLQKTGGVFINGALANVVPATGTATGTATGGSAGVNTTYGTLVDGAQTWTVNDLRGKWVTITAGTGVGQIKVITSNTATTLTIAGTWIAPVAASSVYAIQSPSTLITSPAAAVLDATGGTLISAGGFQIANNVMGVSGATPTSIIIQNVAINSSGGRVVGGSSVNFNQVLMASGTFSFSAGTNVSVTNSSVTSTNTFIGSGALSISNSFIAAQVALSGTSSITSTQFTNTAATGVATLSASSASSMVTVTSVRCDCGSTANSGCIGTVNVAAASGTRRGGSIDIVTGLDVTNCTNAVFASNGGQVTFASGTTFTGNALTYAVNTVNGGAVFIPSAPAITATTAEVSVDNGTATTTFAGLPGLYSCLTSLATGSKVCKL